MTKPPELILASLSEARGRLLLAAGVAFEAVSPGVDEAPLKAALIAEGAKPRDVADALAEAKAVKVSARMPGAFVLGSDQTLDLDGALMDKAETPDEARDHLLALRGRSHRLHTAAVIAVDGAPIWRVVESARLHVRAFSNAFLDGYLTAEADAATSCAGGYKLEGAGVQLFDRIEGDAFVIQGLPLVQVLGFLRLHGIVAA
ncbi:nucleoside triphosphate pyrophosphatase [soil metagenome]